MDNSRLMTIHGGMELEEALADYKLRLAGFIARMAPGAEVDDILQETMVKIAKGWERFRGDSSLSTWMFQIASNTLSDFYRARNSRIITTESRGEEERADESENPLHSAQIKEMSDCIQTRMATLPMQYAKVLVMSEIEGKKLKEIAQMEGTSENNIKVRLHRARKRLRQIIESSCNTSIDNRSVLVCHPKNLE